jgi:hypothetical protein
MVEQRGSDVVIDAPGIRPALINALVVGAGIEVDELRRGKGTLEQAFLELTGDTHQDDHANGAQR